MNRFGIKRTCTSQAEASPDEVSYFDGRQWSYNPDHAQAFTYDDAIARIMVMNLLDSGNLYEPVEQTPCDRRPVAEELEGRQCLFTDVQALLPG